MLWLTKPTNIIEIVILLLVIMHVCPMSIFFWFLGLVESLQFIVLVHVSRSNRSILLALSWCFLFLGICIQFATVLSWRRLRVRLVALYLISMMSNLFVLLKLFLGSLKLRCKDIVQFIVYSAELMIDNTKLWRVHEVGHLEWLRGRGGSSMLAETLVEFNVI